MGLRSAYSILKGGGHGCEAAADEGEGGGFGDRSWDGGCAFDQATGEIVIADVGGGAVGHVEGQNLAGRGAKAVDRAVDVGDSAESEGGGEETGGMTGGDVDLVQASFDDGSGGESDGIEGADVVVDEEFSPKSKRLSSWK